MSEIKNGTITDTFLGFEDHGIFTLHLDIEYDGAGQAFGMHSLKYEKYGIDYIIKLMKTLEVKSFKDLEGLNIRTKGGGFKGPIKAIGHIVKNQWFNPEEDLG